MLLVPPAIVPRGTSAVGCDVRLRCCRGCVRRKVGACGCRGWPSVLEFLDAPLEHGMVLLEVGVLLPQVGTLELDLVGLPPQMLVLLLELVALHRLPMHAALQLQQELNRAPRLRLRRGTGRFGLMAARQQRRERCCAVLLVYDIAHP